MANPKTYKPTVAEEADPFPTPPATAVEPEIATAPELEPEPEPTKVEAAKQSRKASGGSPKPEPTPAEPAKATYRVWAHGTLQRNGKVYQPGDMLPLLVDEAAAIPCLERVES